MRPLVACHRRALHFANSQAPTFPAAVSIQPNSASLSRNSCWSQMNNPTNNNPSIHSPGRRMPKTKMSFKSSAPQLYQFPDKVSPACEKALSARPNLTHGKSNSLSTSKRACVKTIDLPVGKIRPPVYSRTPKLGCNDRLPGPDPQDSHIFRYKTLGNSRHLLAPGT